MTEPDRYSESDGRVLVLDAAYTPCGVVHWTKAVTLLLHVDERGIPAATAVVDTERIISSPSVEIFCPSVIRLNTIVSSTRRRIAMARRRSVFETFGWTCCYCGHKAKGVDRRTMTIDHVMPRSRGGANDPINMVPACRPCNARKADQTPEEAGMRMLFQPKEPNWLQRFEMSFRGRDGKVPEDWAPFVNF